MVKNRVVGSGGEGRGVGAPPPKARRPCSMNDPQVSSKGSSLSGDGEEEGAGKTDDSHHNRLTGSLGSFC